MKKGFTLIELLAVILILGIIALIAIPTVNKIIVEAKTNAFKSSNENIMKAMEEKCQISLLNNDNPIRSYIFKDSKLNYEIDIKGDTPNDGYVLLNNECEVIDYYLTNDSLVYTNDVDAREDYMLKAPTESKSIFNSLYPSYFSNIVTVYFVNHLNIPSEAIEIQDPSVSGNAKIKSWLVPNGENYDLYIGSEKTIYANYDSSRLFYNMNQVREINLDNINTSFVKNMQNLFRECRKLIELDLIKINTDNVTNMANMFHACENLKKINNIKFNTSNVTNLSSMFSYCRSIEYIDLSGFNTSNVVTLLAMFDDCSSLKSLSINHFDTSKVTNMGNVFDNCILLKTIDVSNWKTDNVTNMQYMFGSNNSEVMALEEIKGLENFNVDKVVNMEGMFKLSSNIKKLDLSNWNIKNDTNLTNIFSSCFKLEEIKIKNSTISNLLIPYLPSRVSYTPGSMIIKEDKTGINETELNNINWHIS